ncbi:translation initiation factor IF-3 [Methylophilaceae bacterium]|nr:translation initiation factor IF-3 [Methylophilaceae bacterium]
MALDKDVRINSDIIAQEIRLVGLEAEPLGIVSIAEAMAKADELETDLVEIAPKATPPVCRLMDYGKFKYAQSKKMHEAKTKQKNVQVKEIKFRPGTDDNDYNIKLRNLIKFLGDGDKTKVTLRFRGREIAHQELGMAILKRVQADLEEFGVVEQFPKMEGRQMVMVLAPNKKPKLKSKPKALDENSAEVTDKVSEVIEEQLK